jgi:tRNA threonylcarbamoyladenosine biosynthesis protein TsaE
MKHVFTANHLDDLPQVAKDILAILKVPRVVRMNGEMGAGKTTLVKELVKTLGAEDAGSSPTFALINNYNSSTQGEIYHLDLYRINSLEEALDIGIEDLLYENQWVFIEWADVVLPLLPDDTVTISIVANEDGSRAIEMVCP